MVSPGLPWVPFAWGLMRSASWENGSLLGISAGQEVETVTKVAATKLVVRGSTRRLPEDVNSQEKTREH
jgi:hypothetical protein